MWTEYGSADGLRVAELPRPVPKKGELLIRVHATSVTAGDVELRALRLSIGFRIVARLLMGLRRPRGKVLGQEFSGEVEEVGRDVDLFRKGDSVFGTTGFRFGAYAEYVCVPQRGGGGAVALKPGNMSHLEAATIPTGALEALHFLLRAGDLRRRRVLIIGAAGGIGTIGVQLAKCFGAEVTAVDATTKLGLLRFIGADRVIDYTREDFAADGQQYDVVFDAVGKRSVADCLASLTADGYLLLGNPRFGEKLRAFWIPFFSRRSVVAGAAPHRSEDLDRLRELIEKRQIRATVARRYTLEGIPEAHRYFESGLAIGRIAIDVATVPDVSTWYDRRTRSGGRLNEADLARPNARSGKSRPRLSPVLDPQDRVSRASAAPSAKPPYPSQAAARPVVSELDSG